MTEKLITIQNQVRENSDELQDFLRGLDSWEKEMKQKEEELKLVHVSEEQSIPPVRNAISRSKKKKRQTKCTESSTDQSRISSYDYKKWEKFDVNSELKKLDNEEKKESSTSDCSDKEEKFLIRQNQQLAIIKKDKGNEYFKKGNYDSAINCYTVGMELDPENPILPANRAMALLKKEQFQAAENDCTTCLLLDATYVKGFLRRGTARLALKKYSLAKKDFEKALELEPENKQAQTELDKLEKLEIEPKTVSRSSSNKNIDNTSLLETTENTLGGKVFSEIISPSCSSQSSDITQKTVSSSCIIKPSPSVSSHCDSPSQPSVSHEAALSEIESVITVLEQAMPPVPTASFQFLTDWKKFAKYPELRYQYLKQFPPEKFPVVFKYCMEAEIFPGILSTLSTLFIENGDDVISYLKYLSQVGRFNTMLMFLSGQEKNDLKKLADYLKISGHTSDEVESIMKLYSTF